MTFQLNLQFKYLSPNLKSYHFQCSFVSFFLKCYLTKICNKLIVNYIIARQNFKNSLNENIGKINFLNLISVYIIPQYKFCVVFILLKIK